MNSVKVNPKVVKLLKKRFKEEDADEQLERSYDHAEALFEMGMMHAAKAAFEQLLAADPSDEEARLAIEEIEEIIQ
jgi:cytochrome c-type biogenesis protein CcmH/NrfG